MLKAYHIEICKRALKDTISPAALNIIIAANLAQDGLRGLVGHPEYHFDNNAIEAGCAYIEVQRQIIWDTMNTLSEIKFAWEAFGRLTHAAQDFYAHSNYISLWIRAHHKTELPPPEKVKALQYEILNHPDLCSGKVYLWDWLAFVPGMHGLAQRLLPFNSHTHINLNSPKQGSMFPYAFEAALKRTIIENEQITREFEKTKLLRFNGN